MSNLSVDEVLNNNVDIDTDLDKDLLMRQSKLMYPEVDEWILTLAIEAYLNSNKKLEDMKDGGRGFRPPATKELSPPCDD